MDVSVIVPTLNEEKTIGRCLKSLARQDFAKDYEVIVGDGNSADGTIDIARRYADKVVIEKMRSAAAERQSGTTVAEGEILAFADADVVVDKSWLSQLYYSYSGPRVVGVYGMLVPLDAGKIETRVVKKLFPVMSKATLAIKKPMPCGANMSIRKRVFDRIGGFNLDLTTGEDVELAKRAMEYGMFVFNPNAVVKISWRRVQKWGYLKYFLYHSSNYVRLHATGMGHVRYEPIRD